MLQGCEPFFSDKLSLLFVTFELTHLLVHQLDTCVAKPSKTFIKPVLPQFGVRGPAYFTVGPLSAQLIKSRLFL